MRILLSTVAAAAVLVSTLAFAQDEGKGINLGMTGYFKGYTVYNSQDEAAGTEARDFDIIRDTEIHFVGSMSLDNGLTVGVDVGSTVDQGDSFDIQDSYVYFQGGLGKVNFGATDGAAYLLQVAAPSADANLDGMDQYFTPVNYAATGVAALEGLEFDYDQDLTTPPSDKLTYITPNFAGFQAAVSWTPEVRSSSRSLNGVDDGTGLSDAIDLAARFDNETSWGSYAIGAGYTTAEERDLWNVGVDFNIGAFGIGGVYTHDNMDEAATATSQRQYVLGVDYTVGSYVLGASYLNQNNEFGADEIDTQRYTAGVTYKFGPGVDFKGVVSHINHDVDAALGSDVDATSVLVGTSISF